MDDARAAELLALSDKGLARVINGASKGGTLEPAKRFLREIGLEETRRGPRDFDTEGGWHAFYKHEATGRTFELYSNYYSDDCFVPVVRWALSMQLGRFDEWSPEHIDYDMMCVPGARIKWRNPYEMGGNIKLAMEHIRQYPGELRIVSLEPPSRASIRDTRFLLNVSHAGTLIPGFFHPTWFIPDAE